MGEREALLTERAGHRMAVARPSCVCVTGLWTRTSGSPASDNKDGNKKAGRLPDLLARSGGELGIRTPDTLRGYTRLAGEHLRPLGQLSGKGAGVS